MSHDSKNLQNIDKSTTAPKPGGAESKTPTLDSLPSIGSGKDKTLTPLESAKARLEMAVLEVETGPDDIAERLTELQGAVRRYSASRDLLETLDALPEDAPQPARLPGARAVEALGKRGRPKKATTAAKAAA